MISKKIVVMTRFDYVLKIYLLFEVQLLTGKGRRTCSLEEKVNLHVDLLYNFCISTPLLKLKLTICVISNRYDDRTCMRSGKWPLRLHILPLKSLHLCFPLLFRLTHTAIEANTQLRKL